MDTNTPPPNSGSSSILSEWGRKRLGRTPTTQSADSEQRLRIRDGRVFLQSKDLESAKRFYLDILGMKLDKGHSEWIDLNPTLGLSISTGGEHLIEFHVDNFEETAD